MKKEERTTPKLRFPEFTGDWEKCKLGDVLEVSTRRNGDQFPKEAVLSVSDEFGCVNQIQFQGRSFAGEDISNYKVVDTGDIIYTRSPLRAKPFGIIKIVREETGIVSPLYIVNKAIDGNDAEFLYRVFDLPHKTNNYLSPLVRKGAKNTMNISEDEWLSGSVLVSPFYEEQKKVGKFFKALEDAITLHQRKLEKMQEYKHGMLQKLFPKKGETVPEVRFPGFTGDWEQRKCKDVAPLQRGFDLPVSQMEEGDYPVVMSNGIGGYHSEYKAEGPGIVTGRSGTLGKLHYIEENYWPHNTALWVTDFKGNHPKFIYYLYQKLDLSQFGSGSGVPTLNRNDVHDAYVAIPKVEEQINIADFLTRLDDTITLHQRRLEQMKEYKKGLLQQMFV